MTSTQTTPLFYFYLKFFFTDQHITEQLNIITYSMYCCVTQLHAAVLVYLFVLLFRIIQKDDLTFGYIANFRECFDMAHLDVLLFCATCYIAVGVRIACRNSITRNESESQ